ncbi:hypothetical protein BROUX41_001836 [Berkeleyomyces rouxiae]|uniref:uncharacterized protein n=1 Tax=Berkeleyomyces rouxiae TaxID=2035830 RepID=UPI003B7CCEAC
MMSVLRRQTVVTIQDLAAQVLRQLCDFEISPGETLGELLDRYDDLMARAQVTGLDLEERSKIAYVMSAVGKHYESLETLIRPIKDYDDAYSTLRAEANMASFKRPPVPRPTTRGNRPAGAKRPRTGCWNCNVVGHHSAVCPERRNDTRMRARARGRNDAPNNTHGGNTNTARSMKPKTKKV